MDLWHELFLVALGYWCLVGLLVQVVTHGCTRIYSSVSSGVLRSKAQWYSKSAVLLTMQSYLLVCKFLPNFQFTQLPPVKINSLCCLQLFDFFFFKAWF